MKYIGLPEFGSLEDFVDWHDIVKRHAEHESMRSGDRTGGEHDARSGKEVHGTPDQGLCITAVFKCQDDQI